MTRPGRPEEADVRYLLGMVALAPFVVLLLAMATRRARVQACCAPTAAPDGPEESTADDARPTGRVTPTR